MDQPFKSLIQSVQSCKLCEEHLPLGARPVIQLHPHARILVAGQAPGKKVHETGIPFDDPSGNRLRNWMGITREIFYDPTKIAILPMGFCFPGSAKYGDLPPRPECQEKWRDKLLNQLPKIELTIVLGKYAQAFHFKHHKGSLTKLVKDWKLYWPTKLPLPHPSPRNNIWLKKNPWFEREVIPTFQTRVRSLVHANQDV